MKLQTLVFTLNIIYLLSPGYLLFNFRRSYSSFFLFRPGILIILFFSKSMLLILIIQPNYVEINLKNNYYLLYNIFLRLKWNAYLIMILEGQVLEKVLKYQSRDLN